MNAKACEVANEIIKNLLSHKYANIFATPMDSKKDVDNDYLKIIKNPISFDIISDKITKNEYKSFLQFKQDVELIFTNAEIYFGRNDYHYSIATELKKHFYRSLIHYDKKIWCNRVYEIRSKIQSLLLTPPILVSSGIDITQDIQSQLFNEKSGKLMCTTIDSFTNKTDQKVVINTAAKIQPEFEEGGHFDVTLMKPPTIRAVIKCFKDFGEGKK